MLALMRIKEPRRSIEYMDNRISLYAAQYGRCAVMGMELSIDEIHCHHKVPLNMGGTDEYSNLIILHQNVHTLIHTTNTETIRLYLDIVAPDTKTLDKINKLRIMAGNSKINRK